MLICLKICLKIFLSMKTWSWEAKYSVLCYDRKMTKWFKGKGVLTIIFLFVFFFLHRTKKGPKNVLSMSKKVIGEGFESFFGSDCTLMSQHVTSFPSMLTHNTVPFPQLLCNHGSIRDAQMAVTNHFHSYSVTMASFVMHKWPSRMFTWFKSSHFESVDTRCHHN